MNYINSDPKFNLVCNNAILISGCARSGTSILGKIVHSMKGLEYSFEPPMLISLFSQIEDMDKDLWKSLCEVYLYREFLLNAVAGRAINCNRKDDSSIHHAKSADCIRGRLEQSFSITRAIELARKRRIVVKIPNIVPYLSLFSSYFPDTSIVLMQRNANDVIHSIIKKRWFSQEMLSNGGLLWPNQNIDGISVPFWVLKADVESWCFWNEAERAGYYYLRMYKPVNELSVKQIVSYDKFVANPFSTIQKLADRLGLVFGEKTNLLISSVKRPSSEKPNWLASLPTEMHNEIKIYSRF